MSQINELKTKDGQSTGLVAVVVPKDAYDFEIFNTYRKEVRFLLKGNFNPIACKEQYDTIHLRGFKVLDNVSILGLVTPDTIEFDSAQHVENDGSASSFLDYQPFRGHLYNYFDNADDSFRSLLAVNGLYFFNPCGEKEPDRERVFINVRMGWESACCGIPNRDGSCCGNVVPKECEEQFEDLELNPDWEQWQSHQSKLLTGNLLILKKI